MGVQDWSHACWDIIHVSAHKLATNPDKVRVLLHHIRALLNVIPCPICRSHAQFTLGTLSRSITTQTDISIAMWQFHNSVNEKVGNKYFTWRQYVERYNDQDPRYIAFIFSKQMLHIVAMTQSSSILSDMPKVVNSFASWVHHNCSPAHTEKRKQRRVTMNYAK